MADKETEYPTKVSGWKVAHLEAFFTIDRADFKMLRNLAGQLYNDADDILKKERKGEAVPENLNSRGAKNYVKTVAQRLKGELSSDLLSGHEDEEERLDLALQALVQMGAKESKKHASKLHPGKGNASAGTQDSPGAQPETDSDDDDEAEDLEPSASPELRRHEPRQANSNAHASDSKHHSSAGESERPEVAVAANARGNSPASLTPTPKAPHAAAISADKQLMKAPGSSAHKRDQHSASLDAESLSKSGDETQAKRRRIDLAQGLGMAQHGGLTFGPYRPQRLSKLLDVFVHATDTVGADYAMRIATDIDANEHLHGDAAVETLTKMLNTVIDMEKKRPL